MIWTQAQRSQWGRLEKKIPCHIHFQCKLLLRCEEAKIKVKNWQQLCSSIRISRMLLHAPSLWEITSFKIIRCLLSKANSMVVHDAEWKFMTRNPSSNLVQNLSSSADMSLSVTLYVERKFGSVTTTSKKSCLGNCDCLSQANNTHSVRNIEKNQVTNLANRALVSLFARLFLSSGKIKL